MTFLRKHTRYLAVALVFALIAAACGGGGDDSASGNGLGEDPSNPGLGVPAPNAEVVAETVFPTATPIPAAPEGMFDEPTPTPAAIAPTDPWEVNVLIAKPDTSFVPVFDAPDGETFDLVDVDYITGAETPYPLQSPTYFGNDLALLVLEGKPGDDWALVRVPVRPNDKAVYVQTAFFNWETHNYHITIDLSETSVQVFKGDELIASNQAVVGQEGRPTPVVRTYIDEKIPGDGGAYGSWILSLGAFSEDLSSFSGGLPKLAIHGTNEPGLMGQAVSSGCVRLPNDVIEFIADNVPVGTTVDIIP